MKKIKYLLVVLGLLLLPYVVMAEEKPDKEMDPNSNEVRVYVFRGEGCPHCEEALEWFDSIEEEYGSKFEIIAYETWENDDNATLLEDAIAARSDNAEGVPYIVIGENAWNGFDTTYEEAILDTINKEYEKPVEKRVDVLNLVEKYRKNGTTATKVSADVISIIILSVLIVLGAIGGLVYYLVNSKKEVSSVKEEKVKVVEKPVAKKKTVSKKTAPAKKTTTKKTTTKKKTTSKKKK